MRKNFFIFLAMAMIFSLAPIGIAKGAEYSLIGRELSPGILQPSGDYSTGIYHNALFLGKIFDKNFSDVGYFSVVLDRVNEGVEMCGYSTRIVELKLVMTFKNGSRLVLVMPPGEAEAYWDYNDPECLDGCVFPGYGEYLFLIDPDQQGELCSCDVDGEALIAEVPFVRLQKQWFGSWGPSARRVDGAVLSGWLIHTPLLIPAVYGTVILD